MCLHEKERCPTTFKQSANQILVKHAGFERHEGWEQTAGLSLKKDRWLRTMNFLVIQSNDPAGWTGVPMVLYSPQRVFQHWCSSSRVGVDDDFNIDDFIHNWDFHKSVSVCSKHLLKHMWATKKKRPYFPLNPGCLIGILLLPYYNPYRTV